MRALYHYIRTYLVHNKHSTFLSIVSISIASAMFFIMVSLCVNVGFSIYQTNINSYGNYHAIFSNASQEFEDILALQTDIVKIDKVQFRDEISGIFKHSSKKNYQLLGMTKEDFKDLGHSLLEGYYPTNEHEIIISEELCSEYSLNLYLNKNIILGNEEYRIVGIMLPSFLEKGQDHYSLISLPDKGEQNLFVRYSSAASSKENTNRIASSFIGFDQYYLNEKLMRAELISMNEESFMLWGIVGLIFLTFILVNTALIRNSYKNSYLNREKHLAILKTIGTTNRQCKAMILYEGILFLIGGLTTGLLVGTIIYYLIIMYVNQLLQSSFIHSFQIKDQYLLWIYGATTLYVVFFSFLYIRKSARMALRKNVSNTLQSSDEISVLHQPVFNFNKKKSVLMQIFKKNIRQNFRTYRPLLIGVAAVFTLLILWNGLMGYLRNSGYFDLNDHNYDVKMSFVSTEYPTGFMTQLSNEESIEREVILLKSDDFSSLSQNYLNYMGKHESYQFEVMTYHDEDLKKYAKSIRMSEEDFQQLFDVHHPKGILINQMYDVGYRSFYEILEQNQIKSLMYKNQVVFDGLPLYTSELLITGTSYQEIPQIILSKTVFDDLLIRIGKKSHEYQVFFNSRDANSLTRELYSLENGNLKNFEVINVQETLKDGRTSIQLIRLFSYGYIFSLIVMSILAICCVASTNFEYRKKEFILFNVLGLRMRDMMKLVLMELTFYISLLFIISWGASQCLNVLVYEFFLKKLSLKFFIPFDSVIGSVILGLIVVFVFMCYIYIRLRMQKKTQVLKNEISLM